MILPPPPPADGGLMPIPLVLPKSNELFPVNVPPPEKVTCANPHQVHVQLFAEDITPVLVPVVMNRTGVDEVAVRFVNVVTAATFRFPINQARSRCPCRWRPIYGSAEPFA